MSPSASLTTNASPAFSTNWLPRTAFCASGSGAMNAGAGGAGCGVAAGADERADAGASACGARGEEGSACLDIGTPGLGAARRVRRVFRTG
ncbi:hypothetical protein A8H35_20610 [Burkholderia thailandensis]|nr:hypothetical protein A8H35_20610 [Burkholderia thailandensis]NOK51895.1 hypothetical protein [Burkholderia thailandensis]PJO73539.1 hypothetical protein CWD92_02325 [Burkholderia thailandensis]